MEVMAKDACRLDQTPNMYTCGQLYVQHQP